MTVKVAIELKYRRDELAEMEMRSLGLEWENAELTINDIDWEKSLHNGARISRAVVEDLVEDYMTGKINGDTFPMVVAYRPGNTGKPWIVSGIQRTEATKRLIEEELVPPDIAFPVYLITARDDSMVDVFLRSANTGHGGRSSRDERLEQAVFCVRARGITAVAAAQVFKVCKSTITHRIRADNIRKDLAAAHVPKFHTLSQQHLLVLGKEPEESVRNQFATITAASNVSSERLRAYINLSAKKKSREAKTAVVKEFEAELKKAAKLSERQKKLTRVTKPRRDQMLAMLSKLAAFLDRGNDGGGFSCLSELQCDSIQDSSEVTKLWQRIERRMNLLCE